MSSDSRENLEQRLGEQVRAFQRAVDQGDDEIARLLGLNRTDLRCLDLLLQEGPTAPGRLATELGLTTGSVTAMLDRMEKSDYITRTPDPSDRRKVVVQARPEIADQAWQVMLPLIEDSTRSIAGYSDADLTLLLDFFERAIGIQERQIDRLRAMKPARPVKKS
ncbi:MAG: MarR family transcriptional regulator [Hamadaea sp.]|uniref:MarR family winged helix-turn-helix transcriptional regulator n=1 Tax=Hamadaea sp. TaxID=2024425 RepID=UPI0017DEB439|nr:MarR family transcriptional regulator [Hamadaea sp.]NUR72704.1 MarR family transcriptional regulator [Hamadaea sp.]NUT22337.1 MarR family transcriptional regulator [Hamadaea sp.]